MTEQAKAADRQRIILLFDGTWNDAEFRDNDTNIVRLRELIDVELRREDIERATRGVAQAPAKTLVYYRRGVGTNHRVDKFLGGALGFGLADNVRRGYRFLARHYRPGDEVFVFGFSRGAFTARSLVGYLGAAGLLRDAWCTPGRESAAWGYYRTSPDDRLPGDWHALGAFVHPREAFRIRALCVFDTVGALGIPGTWLKAANRGRFEFHDVELPSITQLNLHAIAIDEQREPFQATIWRRHKFKRLDPKMVTEQAWFPGVHADVGGGYVGGEGRKPGLKALDDIPLDWMLRRLRHHVGDFPAPCGLSPAPDAAWSKAAQHQSRTWKYRYWPPVHRAIANRPLELIDRNPVAGRAMIEGVVSRDRHQAMVGEMVHISAIERLGCDVPCGPSPRAEKEAGRQAGGGPPTLRYAPPALCDALDDLAVAYGPRVPPPGQGLLRIVGRDGFPINPGSVDGDAAMDAVAAAWQRLAYG